MIIVDSQFFKNTFNIYYLTKIQRRGEDLRNWGYDWQLKIECQDIPKNPNY